MSHSIKYYKYMQQRSSIPHPTTHNIITHTSAPTRIVFDLNCLPSGLTLTVEQEVRHITVAGKGTGPAHQYAGVAALQFFFCAEDMQVGSECAQVRADPVGVFLVHNEAGLALTSDRDSYDIPPTPPPTAQLNQRRTASGQHRLGRTEDATDAATSSRSRSQPSR